MLYDSANSFVTNFHDIKFTEQHNSFLSEKDQRNYQLIVSQIQEWLESVQPGNLPEIDISKILAPSAKRLRTSKTVHTD